MTAPAFNPGDRVLIEGPHGRLTRGRVLRITPTGIVVLDDKSRWSAAATLLRAARALSANLHGGLAEVVAAAVDTLTAAMAAYRATITVTHSEDKP